VKVQAYARALDPVVRKQYNRLAWPRRSHLGAVQLSEEPVEETGDSSGRPSTGARVTLAVNTATLAGEDPRALELEGWRAIGGCRS